MTLGSPRQQREDAISVARNRMEACQDQASAFDAAAELLENTAPQHQRYKPDWLKIVRRLRKDAEALREAAERHHGTVLRLQQHVLAASRAVEEDVS